MYAGIYIYVVSPHNFFVTLESTLGINWTFSDRKLRSLFWLIQFLFPLSLPVLWVPARFSSPLPHQDSLPCHATYKADPTAPHVTHKLERPLSYCTISHTSCLLTLNLPTETPYRKLLRKLLRKFPALNKVWSLSQSAFFDLCMWLSGVL